MLKPLLSQLLTHLIEQNTWARAELRPFAGKSVRFSIVPVQASLTILEDGGLAMTGEALSPDATVSLSPSTALRLLANDTAATSKISIEGESEVATTLARVLQDMHWEYEEDLSKVVGDIPAHQFGEFTRKASQEVRKQALNVAEMFAEYWQEEDPLIAKKRHVETFTHAVDDARDDTERLEKRLEKLNKKIHDLKNTENQ